jgi:TRAP-type uncharacterized transport system substrate-binding protein
LARSRLEEIPVIQRAHAFYAEYIRDFLEEYWISILAIVLGLGLMYVYVDPAPPDHVEIAVGSEEDIYRAYAERYKEVLARDHITLNLVPTSGTPENLVRLVDGNTGIDAAFLQDGMTSAEESPNLYSLGSVYYDPLWIFYRTTPAPQGAMPLPAPHGEIKPPAGSAQGGPDRPGLPATPDRLSQLKGLRIATGSGAGGTRLLAQRLLVSAGVNADNTHFVPVGGRKAADALLAGDVDVAMFLSTLDAPWVQQLLMTPGIGLMSVDQADALSRNFPFLHDLVLPHGAIDLATNVPPRDTHLLAPTITLVVRNDLHPALAGLLVKAAIEVHSGPGMLQKEHDFPGDRDSDLPLASEAARYYKAGPPLLQKYLPFWAATLLDRMGLILIPLLAVLIPLVKLAPAVYSWRIRARVYHWYGELIFLEVQLRDAPETANLPEVLERLDWIDGQVNRIHLPLSFSNHLYVLREHIELVRNTIHRFAGQRGLKIVSHGGHTEVAGADGAEAGLAPGSAAQAGAAQVPGAEVPAAAA